MYLTPDWKANNYGETAFFEEVFSKDGTPFPPGKQQYEWIASVRPRYGRIVIFRGIIPHSARPPSPEFSGARYTFACKVSAALYESQGTEFQIEHFRAQLGCSETCSHVCKENVNCLALSVIYFMAPM